MNLLASPPRELVDHGRVYSCGIYYPRQHRNHWHSDWSQAVWRCKRGCAFAIQTCGRHIARILEQIVSAEQAAVMTFVPSEPAEVTGNHRHNRSAAEPLAYAAFTNVPDRPRLSIERLLAPIRQKSKRQHQCRSACERRNNVAHCYAVTCPERVMGRTIIVIDDVVTSGATMRECQSVLLRAGALDVRGIVLARTVGWDINGE